MHRLALLRYSILVVAVAAVLQAVVPPGAVLCLGLDHHAHVLMGEQGRHHDACVEGPSWGSPPSVHSHWESDSRCNDIPLSTDGSVPSLSGSPLGSVPLAVLVSLSPAAAPESVCNQGQPLPVASRSPLSLGCRLNL